LPVRGVPARQASLVGLAMLAGLALSACTFAPSGIEPGPGQGVDASEGVDSATPAVDGSVPPDGTLVPDAPPPMPRDVVHVPPDGWFGGPTAVVWNEDVIIDTSARTLTGPGTEGLEIDVLEHDPPGSEIAILHVGDLTVGSGATVRVVGSRPFVVISSGDIRIEGDIDAGARGETPGAGGAEPGQGPGAGMPGSHTDDGRDSGGGGAGHGTDGARGSDGCQSNGGGSDCAALDRPLGGPGGALYGDAQVTTLTGGSGGGTGGSGSVDSSPGCAPGPGGAGGGGVQLYAIGTITVASGGGIRAGGGGGTGGEGANCAAAAAGGGGSGGVIYLQADRIDLAGTLAANGGGGGAGAGVGSNGDGGSDGALGATPAAGADEFDEDASAGGAGGAGATGPVPGEDDDENGGGGGGAVGRVVLHCNDFAGAGVVSPEPHRTAGCAL
jgi:hypothetical protein